MPTSTLLAADLARVPFLAGLGAGELGVLYAALRRRVLGAGDFLYRQGDPGAAMAIVAEGLLGVQIRSSAGATVEIEELRPWDVVGEMAAIDPAPRSASVQARTETVVLELDRGAIATFRQSSPPVATVLVDHAIARVNARLRDTDDVILAEVSRLRGLTEGQKTSTGAQPDRSPADPLAPTPSFIDGLRRRLSTFLGTPATQSSAAPASPAPVRVRGRPFQLDIRAVPGLEGLTTADIGVLASQAPPTSYAPGTILCHEGDSGHSCFIVALGRVEILCELRGEQRQLASLGPGTIAGQTSLLDDAPRSATIRAGEDLVVLEISRKLFRDLLASSSPFAIRFQEQVAVAGIRQLRMADARLAAVLGMLRSGGRGASNAASQDPAAFYRAALREWAVPLDELDQIQVVRADGLPTGAEIRARSGRKG
jgi:CRP/FNR family transcriptional regulator, cyclic AMP receptor protein